MVDLPWTVYPGADPGRMTAPELRAALRTLGWSQGEAAATLGTCNKQRMSEWCCGKRRVPKYVSEHIYTYLALMTYIEEAME